jgi:hypothetical protein
MYLPFCSGKRWGKGLRKAKPASKSPIPWTPSPHGQAETSRLIAGDESAAADLSKMITRAGVTSSRLPYLNSNGVVATSNLLSNHTDDGVILLVQEQAAAVRQSRATKSWPLFFSNASLIGENFQQGLMGLGLYGQRSRESMRAKDSAPSISKCRGHWQWKLVYCDFDGCSVYHMPSEHPPSRPPTAEDVEELAVPPVSEPSPLSQRLSLTPSLEEELDVQETVDEGEEFSFAAHLRDEYEYEQVLSAVTAVATRPGSAKLVTMSRKHDEVGDVELVSAALELLQGEEAAEEQRWSTQAQTGCPEACFIEAQGKQRAAQSSRLSWAGPPSGPPSIPLPPSPPSSASSLPVRLGE